MTQYVHVSSDAESILNAYDRHTNRFRRLAAVMYAAAARGNRDRLNAIGEELESIATEMEAPYHD